MNDPHVEWLRYRLETSEGLKFTDPPTLHHEENGRFACALENNDLTATMLEHHADVPSARAVVEPFLETWEVAEALKRGQRELWFVYGNARMIDRSPPPPGGSQVIRPMAVDVLFGVGVPKVIRGEHAYPPPPSGFVVSPDVKMLFARYQGYADGREPLAGMAYACYKYIVQVLAPDQAAAARKFNLSGGRGGVLSTLNRLAGGGGRRKDLTQKPYTPQEETWVATTIRVLIRRVGEHESGTELKLITMVDLPKLS